MFHPTTWVVGIGLDVYGRYDMADREIPRVPKRALNDRQLAFAIWLATPSGARVPREQKDLAVTLGVSRQMLWRWSKDPRVLEASRIVVLQNAGDPGKITDILDMIHNVAVTRSDLKAAELWLKAVGAMASLKSNDTSLWDEVTDKALDALSDEQLDAAIAAKQAEQAELESIQAAKRTLAAQQSALED